MENIARYLIIGGIILILVGGGVYLAAKLGIPFGIDRLIAFRVTQFFMNIGRERHMAYFREIRLDRFGKLDHAL